jgi:hypothetical protein
MGLIAAGIVYLVAGSHAGLYLSDCVYSAWTDGEVERLTRAFESRKSLIFHHWLYWLGLVFCLGGLVAAKSGL